VYASNVPGAKPYYNSGAVAVGKTAGVATSNNYVDVPIQDANSLVLKIVQQAGADGGTTFGLIPPEGLKVILAASANNLIDRIHWAGATPFNSAFIAQAMGPEWDGKFLVNAEFDLIDSKKPDAVLWRQLVQKYQPKCPDCFGSFGQMGFLVGKVMTYTLLALKPTELTRKGVNNAILRIKNFKSDMWCKPFYVGNIPYHIPNNTDRTVTPVNHKFVQKEGCFPIAPVDKEIVQTRKWEKQFKLTSGTSWPPVPGQ
jgi:branched-chain amino acid transport system substrate-binding protein